MRVRVNSKRISHSHEGGMQLFKTHRNVLVLGAIERAGSVDEMPALSNVDVRLFEDLQLN